MDISAGIENAAGVVSKLCEHMLKIYIVKRLSWVGRLVCWLVEWWAGWLGLLVSLLVANRMTQWTLFSYNLADTHGGVLRTQKLRSPRWEFTAVKKAWSRSEYKVGCFACCQELFLPNFCLLIHFQFFPNHISLKRWVYESWTQNETFGCNLMTSWPLRLSARQISINQQLFDDFRSSFLVYIVGLLESGFCD